jgi:sugar lactone lactonase YvrE
VTATQGYAEGAPSFRVWSGGSYELAGGTRWLGDHLVFTDILAGALLAAPAAGPGAARPLASLDMPLGAIAPVAGRPGTWIAAAGTGIALIGEDGTLTWLDRPEDRSPVPMRTNDSCCDPGGRFWAGSMALPALLAAAMCAAAAAPNVSAASDTPAAPAPSASQAAQAGSQSSNGVALTPPMGWND